MQTTQTKPEDLGFPTVEDFRKFFNVPDEYEVTTSWSSYRGDMSYFVGVRFGSRIVSEVLTTKAKKFTKVHHKSIDLDRLAEKIAEHKKYSDYAEKLAIQQSEVSQKIKGTGIITRDSALGSVNLQVTIPIEKLDAFIEFVRNS